MLSSVSTETINDGQFHTVELVTFDQMVNLSIDGGLPTTMDSFGAVRPLNGEAPLYVGGRGPLQNTPPSSAGTLNYYTTVQSPPFPLRFVATSTSPSHKHATQPPPRPCPPSSILTIPHVIMSVLTVFARVRIRVFIVPCDITTKILNGKMDWKGGYSPSRGWLCKAYSQRYSIMV